MTLPLKDKEEKMRTVLTMLFLFCGTISCFAQQVSVERITLPAEVQQEIVVPSTDADIKDLQWNRWTSESFVVCSINDKQAQYLVANLENIKNWVYTRWGFKNQKFVAECRLICVDDPKLFKKFFDLDSSRAEIRYDSKTNKPNLIVIFYLLDQTPSTNIPGPLTEICLTNIDEIYDIDSKPWSVMGMRALNENIPSIKSKFTAIDLKLQQDQPIYFSRGLFEMTKEQYQKLDTEHRVMFDNNAMAMCLFMRKEFGQNNFHVFYYKSGKNENPADLLKLIYKFESYEKFDQAYKNFLLDTVKGLKNDSIRDSYFQINQSGG